MRRAILAVVILSSGAARATGHGPVFGLATPTLPKGGVSLDVGAMLQQGGPAGDLHGYAAMLRPMLGYGLTEDLEISLSAPLPILSSPGQRPGRMMGMMPATPDAEALLAWRFARDDTGVGSRVESTALLGLDYPTDARRAGIQTAPGFVAGVVTGYVSRSVYAWAGALYRRYMTPLGGDHPGDLLFYSAVIGYRPEAFRQELPHADWRFFIEAVGEVTGHDRLAGAAVPNTGGHQLFIGPTVLGLFGAWGISGGPQLPLYSRLDGTQPEDHLRLVTNFTYWF